MIGRYFAKLDVERERAARRRQYFRPVSFRVRGLQTQMKILGI